MVVRVLLYFTFGEELQGFGFELTELIELDLEVEGTEPSGGAGLALGGLQDGGAGACEVGAAREVGADGLQIWVQVWEPQPLSCKTNNSASEKGDEELVILKKLDEFGACQELVVEDQPGICYDL
jgi:hypothetical protein